MRRSMRLCIAKMTRLLIAGDMVLPRISTNVSVFDLEPEADPLPRYLRSLDRLLMLPADTLVLPSHGKPFIGLHQRIAAAASSSCGPAWRSACGVLRAADCSEHRAGAVQAPARSAPDDVCAG